MEISKELERLKQLKDDITGTAQAIKEAHVRELEEAKKQIDEKYLKLESANYKELYELDSCYQLLAEASTFNGSDIGNIIASLVGTFEGTIYVYQDTYCEKKSWRNLAFDREEIIVTTPLRMVVAQENKSKMYSSDTVKSLVKNGKAIVLSSADTINEQISFYKANRNNHSLDQTVEFGKFDYVKEFIDKAISYKLEKNSNDISYGELEDLEIEFLSALSEVIEENYRKVYEQRKRDLDEEKKKLLLGLAEKFKRDSN